MLEWIGRLWGAAMVALLTGTGVWFTTATGWMQLRHGVTVVRLTLGSLLHPRRGDAGEVSPFRAMTAALGGTMGTGNVAGVATALVAGGPGAIFWMWVSAFFGMMTKYAEVVLAVHYRERAPDGSWRGGPMTYMRQGLGAPWLAVLFSFCCVLASLGVGSAAQVHSMASALESSFAIPLPVTGLITGVAVALVISGGFGRISSFTLGAVPLMSLFYLGCGGLVLWMNRQNLPQAFGLIFRCAFCPQAALGGAGGYTLARAISLGVARGVFTNEAGLGSAPMAHASSSTTSPVEQGMWGIFEVFVDTLVVCTFTALIILSSGPLWQSGLNGAALTSAAFRLRLGDWGGQVVAVALVCFAFTAVISWAYYGQRAVEDLTGGSIYWVKIYRAVYILVTALSPVLALDTVWKISDLFNSLMALPNLLALLWLGRVVTRLTRHYFSSSRQPFTSAGRE